MSGPTHSFSINLLFAHDSATAHGFALEPELLELLWDHHPIPVGKGAIYQRIRSDGPVQPDAEGAPKIGVPI